MDALSHSFLQANVKRQGAIAGDRLGYNLNAIVINTPPTPSESERVKLTVAITHKSLTHVN